MHVVAGGLCLLVTAAAVVAAARAGTSPAGQPVPASVSLSVTGSDGDGNARFAGLTCRGSLAAGTGFLRPRAVAACASARRLGAFLAAGPDPGRICTQIYGGRDTARVRGRVGVRVVDRRFSRHNGCAIADWATAQGVLYRPRGVTGL